MPPAGHRLLRARGHSYLPLARGGHTRPTPGEVADCFLRLDGMSRRWERHRSKGCGGWNLPGMGCRSAYPQGGRQSGSSRRSCEATRARTASVPGQHAVTGKPGKPADDRAPGGAIWVRDSGCTHARLDSRPAAQVCVGILGASDPPGMADTAVLRSAWRERASAERQVRLHRPASPARSLRSSAHDRSRPGRAAPEPTARWRNCPAVQSATPAGSGMPGQTGASTIGVQAYLPARVGACHG